jgi:GAF domain-containing protein
MSPPPQPRAGVPATVCFPAIGGAVPGRDLDDAALGRRLRNRLPHWLYHLAVWPPGSAPPPRRFTPVSPGQLRALVSLLGFAPDDYEVTSLEFGPCPPGDCSDLAFPLKQDFNGTSYFLSLLAGLTAAATGRALPPWVVLSGCLAEPLDAPLTLSLTRQVEAKVRLSLGRDADYDIRFLVDRLFQHAVTPRWLGPREQRTVSGEVKLLIVPTDVDQSPWDLHDRFRVEPISASFRALEHDDFGELRRRVEDLADDGLLVVQVPTAFHALRLLGYHHRHPLIAARAGSEEMRAFRVRHGPSGREADEEYGRRRSREVLDLLEPQLRRTPGLHGKLQLILRYCVESLGYSAGNIAKVGPDPELLEVIASWGPGMDELPYSVPARIGVNGQVMTSGTTQVVPSAAQHKGFAETFQAGALLASLYREEDCQRYLALLARIGSCVDVPLKRGRETIGVLCLHRASEGRFDAAALAVVEALAERASYTVASRLEFEESKKRERAFASAEALAGRVGRLPAAEAVPTLGRELAELARELSGAYRTAVRILSQDGRSLVVIGLAGDAWPVGFDSRTFPREAVCAANHALESGESYLIRDTRRKDIYYQEVHPPAHAHAAILLRSGARLVGVLSVDFDWANRGACDDVLRERLERLAAPYANFLNAFSIDQLCASIDAHLEALGDGDGKPNFYPFLETVTRAVGVECGALFLRRPETGHYHEVASLAHPASIPHGAVYEPGKGFTGWIVRTRKPLRVQDCRDEAEMGALQPPIEPSRYTYLWDRERTDLAFLGVPVMVGDDVLGVLRVLYWNDRAGPGQPAAVRRRFDPYSQQVLEAAASRLGRWFHKRQEATRSGALLELTRAAPEAPSRSELCTRIFHALQTVIGPCCCLIRAVDRVARGHGVVREVIDLVFVSDDSRDIWPPFREKGDGLSGSVWAEGKTRVIQDTRNDVELQRILASTAQPEEWWRRTGCAVWTLMKAGDKVVGTLALHRGDPETLLQGDIDFVEKVAGLAGDAFVALAAKEERQVQEALLWAGLTYCRGLLAEQGRAERALHRLFQEASNALVVGLGGKTGYVWVANHGSGRWTGLPGADGAASRMRDLPLAAVEEEMGEGAFVVVSDPARDGRLGFLLEALPAEQQTGTAGCQRAAIRLVVDEQPRALFFVVVRPPERLSYLAVERALRLLTTTVGYSILGNRAGMWDPSFGPYEGL